MSVIVTDYPVVRYRHTCPLTDILKHFGWVSFLRSELGTKNDSRPVVVACGEEALLVSVSTMLLLEFNFLMSDLYSEAFGSGLSLTRC